MERDMTGRTSLLFAALTLTASAALATPGQTGSSPSFSSAQTSTGFVCPVISTDQVLNSPKGGTLAGGDYTIGGPDVSVPTHATNGDGTGSPQGTHSSPGDTNYSAIWSLSIDTC
jgi:hypothetical protein